MKAGSGTSFFVRKKANNRRNFVHGRRTTENPAGRIGPWPPPRRAQADPFRTGLFCQRLLTLLGRGGGWLGRRQQRFRLFGLPQRAQALHVLADRYSIALDIGHGAQAFLVGQALPVGSGDALWRGVSWFLAGHAPSRFFTTNENPPDVFHRAGSNAASVRP